MHQGMGTKKAKTLEQRTGCRLFSERAIAAIAEHEYDEVEYDEDLANDLAYEITKILWDHEPEIVAYVARSVVTHALSRKPALLANLLAFLGVVLDSELLHHEQLAWSRAVQASDSPTEAD